MYQPKDTQERIIHRLKIAKGHLEKVLKMAENGEYCIDIINQSRAVQNALREVDALTLENHLKTCVAEHIKNGEADTSVEEVMKIFKNTK